VKPTESYEDYKPKGWHCVTPRIVAKDAQSLVVFLKSVFGATGDYDQDRPSQLTIGDSIVMITDAGVRSAFPAFLYVYVPDVDATYARALNERARSLETPTNTPYGDRRAMVTDRWGNAWQIASINHDAT
jgi:Uncharacterized protein conserved in bacteria